MTQIDLPVGTLYGVMRLMRFDALEVQAVVDGRTIETHWMPPVTDDDSVPPKFYLPVFETMEQALQWNEDGKFPIVLLRPAHEHDQPLEVDGGG